jgi:hypothetical protein
MKKRNRVWVIEKFDRGKWHQTFRTDLNHKFLSDRMKTVKSIYKMFKFRIRAYYSEGE